VQRDDYAVVAEWTEYRKIVGDKPTGHTMSEPRLMFGPAREAAITGAHARLRDLAADPTTADPRVMVLRRRLDLDRAGDVVSRGSWHTVLELEPELTLQVET